MDYFKRFDLYEPKLTFHQTKSGKRGLALIATILSFIVFFSISFYFRFTDPSILTTYDIKYLPTNLLRDKLYKAIDIEIRILPHFSEELSKSCKPKLQYFEKNGNLKFLTNKIEDFEIENQSSVFIIRRILKVSDTFTNVAEVMYDKSCFNTVPFSVLTISYDYEVFNSHLIGNSKKLKSFRQDYSEFLHFNNTHNIKFKGLLNTLYNDYKNLFDGDRAISTYFNSSIISNQSFLIASDYKASFYTLESFSTKTRAYAKYVVPVIISFDLDTNNFMSFLNSYSNPIMSLLLYFSVFTILLRLSNLFVKLLYKDYKLFNLINFHCEILTNFEDKKSKSTLNSKTNENLQICNKQNDNSFITKINNNNFTNNLTKNIESNRTSTDLNDGLLDSVIVEIKNRTDYKNKYLFLFCIPCLSLRSKLVNTKYKILNEIRNDIINNYDRDVSSENIFTFFTNYKKLYGDSIFNSPLYSYSINSDLSISRIS